MDFSHVLAQQSGGDNGPMHHGGPFASSPPSSVVFGMAASSSSATDMPDMMIMGAMGSSSSSCASSHGSESRKRYVAEVRARQKEEAARQKAWERQQKQEWKKREQEEKKRALQEQKEMQMRIQQERKAQEKYAKQMDMERKRVEKQQEEERLREEKLAKQRCEEELKARNEQLRLQRREEERQRKEEQKRVQAAQREQEAKERRQQKEREREAKAQLVVGRRKGERKTEEKEAETNKHDKRKRSSTVGTLGNRPAFVGGNDPTETDSDRVPLEGSPPGGDESEKDPPSKQRRRMISLASPIRSTTPVSISVPITRTSPSVSSARQRTNVLSRLLSSDSSSFSSSPASQSSLAAGVPPARQRISLVSSTVLSSSSVSPVSLRTHDSSSLPCSSSSSLLLSRAPTSSSSCAFSSSSSSCTSSSPVVHKPCVINIQTTILGSLPYFPTLMDPVALTRALDQESSTMAALIRRQGRVDAHVQINEVEFPTVLHAWYWIKYAKIAADAEFGNLFVLGGRGGNMTLPQDVHDLADRFVAIRLIHRNMPIPARLPSCLASCTKKEIGAEKEHEEPEREAETKEEWKMRTQTIETMRFGEAPSMSHMRIDTLDLRQSSTLDPSSYKEAMQRFWVPVRRITLCSLLYHFCTQHRVFAYLLIQTVGHVLHAHAIPTRANRISAETKSTNIDVAALSDQEWLEYEYPSILMDVRQLLYSTWIRPSDPYTVP